MAPSHWSHSQSICLTWLWFNTSVAALHLVQHLPEDDHPLLQSGEPAPGVRHVTDGHPNEDPHHCHRHPGDHQHCPGQRARPDLVSNTSWHLNGRVHHGAQSDDRKTYENISNLCIKPVCHSSEYVMLVFLLLHVFGVSSAGGLGPFLWPWLPITTSHNPRPDTRGPSIRHTPPQHCCQNKNNY